MTIFPAQYSTLCAKALGKELSKRYGLANCSCRLLMRNVSDTYLLEASGRQYIFKLYRDSHRKLEEIRSEAALLIHLKENGDKVSYPLDDRDGEQLQAAEGQRWGLLFTYAMGGRKVILVPISSGRSGAKWRKSIKSPPGWNFPIKENPTHSKPLFQSR